MPVTEPEKLWVVLDQDSTVYAAAHPRACHEHINDAIDNDVQDAGKMVVREYVSLKEHSDELARLRAEVESLKDESARDYADMRRFQALYIEADHARLALRAEVETLKSEDARLRAENERLKADAADAARYRWIKRGASFREERDMGPGGCWSIFVAVPRRPAVNSLDTAIDAAMAQGKV